MNSRFDIMQQLNDFSIEKNINYAQKAFQHGYHMLHTVTYCALHL